MRQTFIVSVALLGVCAVSAPAFAECGKGKPSFEDTFQTLDPTWGKADETLSVQNGSLIIMPKPGYLRWALSQSDLYGDGSICVTESIVEASAIDQAQALVEFWASDYSNMYILNIGSDGKQGYYKIDRLTNGHWLTPIGWTPDPAIKFGLGDQNSIEVDLSGRTAAITINGKQMTSFHGNPPDGGSLVGLGAGSGKGVTVKVAFQKFQFFKAANP